MITNYYEDLFYLYLGESVYLINKINSQFNYLRFYMDSR